MSTPAQHVAKGSANESVARGLDTVAQVDWKIVAWFYADLHFVEARLVEAGEPAFTHSQRRDAMRRVDRLRPLVADYDALRSFAQTARYDASVRIKPDKAQEICDLAADLKQRLGF